MITAEDIKDLVCQKYGHRDFLQFKIKCFKQANPLHDMIPMMNEVCEEYANQSLKEHLSNIKHIALTSKRKPSGLDEIVKYCEDQIKEI